jgi:hypothetical protein
MNESVSSAANTPLTLSVRSVGVSISIGNAPYRLNSAATAASGCRSNVSSRRNHAVLRCRSTRVGLAGKDPALTRTCSPALTRKPRWNAFDDSLGQTARGRDVYLPLHDGHERGVALAVGR